MTMEKVCEPGCKLMETSDSDAPSDQKRHQEMMGALYGMKGEMTASREESNRQFKAQKAYNKEQRTRDRARSLGSSMSMPAGERVHPKAMEDTGRRSGDGKFYGKMRVIFSLTKLKNREDVYF
jgi:hypothetical protein